MAKNTPHVPAAQDPKAQTPISSEPERLISLDSTTDGPSCVKQNGTRGGAQDSVSTSLPPSVTQQLAPPNPNPASNPIQPPPAPSGTNAAWLGITLLNLILIVLLLPTSLLENKQIAFIVKVITVVGAAGAFAAGVVWFRNLATSLPNKRWFKVLNVVLLCTLIPANVSQLPVVPVNPQIEPGTTIEIDNQKRVYNGGSLMLSVNSHNVKITPSDNHQGKPFEYEITFGEMALAIFRGYQKRWTPLYLVYINTNDPDVDIIIRKTDGDFDAGYLEKPERSKRGYPFRLRPGSRDTFNYRGGPNLTGSDDELYLPYGEYKFIVEPKGPCMPREISLTINEGKPNGHTVDLGSLCDPPQ